MSLLGTLLLWYHLKLFHCSLTSVHLFHFTYFTSLISLWDHHTTEFPNQSMPLFIPTAGWPNGLCSSTHTLTQGQRTNLKTENWHRQTKSKYVIDKCKEKETKRRSILSFSSFLQKPIDQPDKFKWGLGQPFYFAHRCL